MTTSPYSLIGRSMSSSSDRDVRPTAEQRRTRLRRRRARRQLVRLSVLGLVMLSMAQVVNSGRSSADEGKEVVESIRLTPLWRSPADVLDREVRTGPWRLRTVGFDESTRKLLRDNDVYTFARRYKLTTELAGHVYDAALEEKIEPELAFRLVRLESRFDPNVVSSAGAIGLTQLMLGTARYFQPGVSAEDLTDPATNLRIGFRYLRGLIREHDGNLKLALLVYNRGPTAVLNAIAMGEDPANGYDRILMRGYTGTGVID